MILATSYVFHLAVGLFEGCVPIPSLLDRTAGVNRMNKSLPVDLHFLLHEENLSGTHLNVLEVISKQSIDFLLKKKNLKRRESKTLGGF